jgi:hypothetical protein
MSLKNVFNQTNYLDSESTIFAKEPWLGSSDAFW